MVERNRWHQARIENYGLHDEVRFCVTNTGCVYISDKNGRIGARRSVLRPHQIRDAAKNVLELDVDDLLRPGGSRTVRLKDIEAE